MASKQVPWVPSAFAPWEAVGMRLDEYTHSFASFRSNRYVLQYFKEVLENSSAFLVLTRQRCSAKEKEGILGVSMCFIIFIRFVSHQRRNIFTYSYPRLLDVYNLIFRDFWSQTNFQINFKFMHIVWMQASMIKRSIKCFQTGNE